MRRSGFTILELLVVLAIMSILSVIGYKAYDNVITKSKASQLVDQLAQIKVGLAKYYKDTGTYPCKLRWLIERPTVSGSGNNAASCYDAVSIAAGLPNEDEEVLNYWSGPYVADMKLGDATLDARAANILSANGSGSGGSGGSATATGGIEDCLHSSAGGVICIGSVVEVNNNEVKPLVNTGQSYGQNNNNNLFYNVLLSVDVSRKVAKAAANIANNGKKIENAGNARKVATGENRDELIGLPNISNYNGMIIYRYTLPY